MRLYCFLLSLLWLLCACSPNDHVEFKPKKGDKADYWVQTNTSVAVAGRTVNQHSWSLMHYHVTDTGSTLKLDLIPKFMRISDRGMSFNSVKSSNDDAQLRQLLSKGFEITLDSQSGELLAFTGKDTELWQEALARGGQQIIEQIGKGIDSPGLIQAIPAKEGSELTLDSFNGYSVKLLVTKVTADSIEAELSSSKDNTHLYGRIFLDRHSGWLQKMVLILDADFNSMGQKGRNHTQMVMALKDNPDYIPVNISQLSAFDDFEHWLDITSIPEELTTKVSLDAEQFFQYGKGGFYSRNGNIHSTLLLSEQENQALKISIKDIKAFDVENKPVDIELVNIDESDYYFDGGVLSVEQEFLPLGWGSDKSFDKIARLTATAEVTPTTLNSVSGTWKPQSDESFVFGDRVVTIIPVEQHENEYLVHFSAGSGRILPFFGGFEGSYRPLSPKVGPEWLSGIDRTLLFSDQQLFHLKLMKPLSEFTFYTLINDEQQAISHQVEWLQRSVFAADYTLPRFISTSRSYFGTEQASLDVENFDIESFATSADTEQDARAMLPSDWAASCQLQVEKEIKHNDHPLIWNIIEKDNHKVNYQLSTDDGIRHYFYGLDVPSRLSCEGRPQWKPLDYTPSERAWLVPVEIFNNLDLQQSVLHFLQHYRFYDGEGNRLFLLDLQAYTLGSEDVPLTQAIMEDKFLRVSGKVMTISKLEYQGEPIDIRWVNRFPPLP